MILHSLSLGSGPPLVFLHGLFGSHDNFLPIAQALAASHTCLLLDLPNHGRSPHASGQGPAPMAAAALETVLSLGHERFALLGHSLGARVAMRLALAHPEAVDRLVIVDMAARAYAPRHLPLFEAMLGLDLGHLSGRGQADLHLAAAVPDRGERQFLLKNLVRDEGGRWSWRLGLKELEQDYALWMTAADLQGSYPGPVLLVRGKDSDYVRDEDLAGLKRLFPALDVKDLPAGHWVHAERPEEFGRMLAAFLGA